MLTDIRCALPEDLAALTAIYNHYVTTSHVTFDVDTFTAQQREVWFSQFDSRRYQCWVARLEGETMGYACSTPLRAKPAYQTSVEVSVYLAPGHAGLGTGRRLYEELLNALAQQDIHRAYALIAQPNEASMKLHRSFNFEAVATLHEVGRKFDRYWDVVWLQRRF